MWRQELRGLEKANKNSALKAWRHHILNEPAGMGTWLRHRERVPVTSVIRNGQEADSPAEIAHTSFEFWTGFWKQASDNGPSTEDVCHKLSLTALRDSAATQWAPPDLELLVRKGRLRPMAGKAKRSGASRAGQSRLLENRPCSGRIGANVRHSFPTLGWLISPRTIRFKAPRLMFRMCAL